MISDPALFDLKAVLDEFRDVPRHEHSRVLDARVLWACLGTTSSRIYGVLSDLQTRPIIWNSDEKQNEKDRKNVEAALREGIKQEHLALYVNGTHYLINSTIVPEITGFMEPAMAFGKRVLPPEAKLWADTDGNASVTIGNSVFYAGGEDYIPARAIIEVILMTLISLKASNASNTAGQGSAGS